MANKEKDKKIKETSTVENQLNELEKKYKKEIRELEEEKELLEKKLKIEINKKLEKKFKELDKKNIEIETKTLELKEKVEELERQKLVLQQKEKTLESLKKNYSNENEKLLKKESALEKEKEALNIEKEKYNKKIELKHSEDEIVSKQVKIKEKEEEIKNKSNELAMKEESIRVLEKAIKELSESNQKEFTSRIQNLENKERELEEREYVVREEKVNLEKGNRRLLRREELVEREEKELETEREERYRNEIDDLNSKLESAENEKIRLREDRNRILLEKEKLDSFIKKYEKSPESIENETISLRDSNDKLRDELAKRPTVEDLNYYKGMENTYKKLQNDYDKYIEKFKIKEQELKESDQVRFERDKLKRENDDLTEELELNRMELKDIRSRLERLISLESRESSREERIKEIQNYKLAIIQTKEPEIIQDELEWLDTIYNNCKAYGVTFSHRILYSFHTALKISDWSTITVLAGVSGTGKSELPKLYSAFGGLNFISVPVQPSWDSQESMLGFFNSIDNRFEPEELLQFLAICSDENRREASDFMSIVLLDEMNLAHIEHYFAEFLSKLESRRGFSSAEVPTVDVKLGAGITPYHLKLSRNIMWTGTMNQDETTKALSDKVLDRGIVINFPRPSNLVGRKKMENITAMIRNSNRARLTKFVWGQWIERNIELIGEEKKLFEKYHSIANRINEILEGVGRAIGHRVWQSIEFYIVNYPTVIAERKKIRDEINQNKEENDKRVEEGTVTERLKAQMNLAFEDQIVQKIMPKLRGIETRGRGRETLNAIRSLLSEQGFENLLDDFNIACEQGYGQFMWSSSKYMAKGQEEEESQEIVEN